MALGKGTDCEILEVIWIPGMLSKLLYVEPSLCHSVASRGPEQSIVLLVDQSGKITQSTSLVRFYLSIDLEGDQTGEQVEPSALIVNLLTALLGCSILHTVE